MTTIFIKIYTFHRGLRHEDLLSASTIGAGWWDGAGYTYSVRGGGGGGEGGVLLIFLIGVGQGPTALIVGAGGCCLDVFSLVYHFSFSHSLGDGPIYTEILSQKGR